jgi:acetoacetyl-CoA synthetase
VVTQLPRLEQLVLLNYLDETASLDGAISFAELCSPLDGDPDLEFAQLPFGHPLYVMFSSGTTGKPKCIVHGQGGTLLQHLKEQRLHCDLREGQKLFYFTTTGWMMWNWLVSGLASGATICLWDGNPFHPGPEAIWDFVAREEINYLGTSAKWVDACKKAGYKPPPLPMLRVILSTGSPLVPESFDWLAEHAPGVQVASISGGTDLLSCFALGNPVLPVRRGELQSRGLGMAVDVWDEQGLSVLEEQGELVCTKTFPSMPVGFWNDPEGSRYHAAYFEYYPGIWRHGDWVQLSAHGGLTIFGRSDTTLNPGGVRIGTAEIYRQVEQITAIEEAVVVGRDTGDGDQEVVLFVRMSAGSELSTELEAEIRTRIRSGASPRHVPAVIRVVADIPRTRSGKISELAVRDVLHGRPVKNTEALANPESLDQFLLDDQA